MTVALISLRGAEQQLDAALLKALETVDTAPARTLAAFAATARRLLLMLDQR